MAADVPFHRPAITREDRRAVDRVLRSGWLTTGAEAEQFEAEFAQAEADAAFGSGGDDEDFSGRCAAVLSNGKRCPNEALPGSRYCGIPAHQALAKQEAAMPAEAPPDADGSPEEVPVDQVPAEDEATAR